MARFERKPNGSFPKNERPARRSRHSHWDGILGMARALGARAVHIAERLQHVDIAQPLLNLSRPFLCDRISGWPHSERMPSLCVEAHINRNPGIV